MPNGNGWSRIFVSLFVFFDSFAINQFLQYRQVGPWRYYLFGEAVYVGLSLVAKSLLAWQVHRWWDDRPPSGPLPGRW